MRRNLNKSLKELTAELREHLAAITNSDDRFKLYALDGPRFGYWLFVTLEGLEEPKKLMVGRYSDDARKNLDIMFVKTKRDYWEVTDSAVAFELGLPIGDLDKW